MLNIDWTPLLLLDNTEGSHGVPHMVLLLQEGALPYAPLSWGAIIAPLEKMSCYHWDHGMCLPDNDLAPRLVAGANCSTIYHNCNCVYITCI